MLASIAWFSASSCGWAGCVGTELNMLTQTLHSGLLVKKCRHAVVLLHMAVHTVMMVKSL